MKYLAMILAVLTAQNGHCSAQSKFVVESIELTMEYKGFHGIIQENKIILNPSNPTYDLYFTNDNNIGNGDGAVLRDVQAYGTFHTPVDPHELGPIRGSTSMTVTINKLDGAIQTDADDVRDFTDKTVPYTRKGDTSIFGGINDFKRVPVHVNCALPEYLYGPSDMTHLLWGSRLVFHIDPIGIIRRPDVRMTCKLNLKRTIELSVRIDKPVMTISGPTGSTATFKNHVVVAGTTAPARLRIENPSSSFLSVSFSESDDTVTERGVVPSAGGAPQLFYVKVKDTSAGTRTYTSNFIAEYL